MTQTTARPKARKASKASAPIAATEPRSCLREVQASTWELIYEGGFPPHVLAPEMIHIAAGIVCENDLSTRKSVARELRRAASRMEGEFPAMKRTPSNPVTARYHGCTPRQIARLMCRSISMAAFGRHAVSRSDMAEQLICEAMDLGHDGLSAKDRQRLTDLLRDAIVHVEKAADGPSEFFRPLP